MTHELPGRRATGVPFRALHRQVADPSFGWERALRRCVESGDFADPSRMLAEFERQFARFCGADHAVATASGSAALQLALLAAGIGPGDEVVTVPNTFVATVEAIRLVGATPVLVDVERDSYTLDPTRLEAVIGARTRAVMPVHLYGRPVAMAPILEIARRAGLVVIEEACHATGAIHQGAPCGSLGDLAVFSFGRTKPFAGLGEGGAVTTSDRELARRLRLLNSHGAEAGDHVCTGFNFRMHPLEAAVLSARLENPTRWLETRREIAARYTAAFSDLGIVHNPVVPTGDTHAFYVFGVDLRDRDAFLRHLDRHEIGWGIHYENLVHRQSAHRRLGQGAKLAVAEFLADRIVSLPLFVGLTDSEVQRVIDVTRVFFASRTGGHA